MKRRWVKVLIGIVVAIAILIFVVPLFINANTFRPVLESQLTQVLGRKVSMGHLSFSVFPGSLVAKDLAISDDPAFSTHPFLEAKSLRVGVEVWPLLLHRKLIVRGFSVDSPSIQLIDNGAGQWNFSSMGKGGTGNATPANATPSGEGVLPQLTIGELKIQNGQAAVSTLGSSKPAFVYRNLNLSAQNFAFQNRFPFTASAEFPGGGELQVSGQAGPVNRQDSSDTPFQAALTLKHFDPVAAGILEKSAGIGMQADIAANLNSNGETLSSDGTVEAAQLVLSPKGNPAPRPVALDYAVRHDLAKRSGNIDRLNLKTGKVAIACTGTYQVTGNTTNVALKVSIPQVPIDQVEELMPAAGVQFPKGSRLQGGTLKTDLQVSGPVSALTIRGPVEIDNTRLAGFDLGSQIGGLHPVSGTGSGTAIRTLRANLTSSPAGTTVENLYLSVPALGTATGSGTVSPAGTLDFHVLAKLDPSTGSANQALAGLSNLHGVLGQIVGVAEAKGIPIVITGTSTNPRIQADVNQLVQKNAGGALQQEIKRRLGNGEKKPDTGSIFNRLLGGSK